MFRLGKGLDSLDCTSTEYKKVNTMYPQGTKHFIQHNVLFNETPHPYENPKGEPSRELWVLVNP